MTYEVHPAAELFPMIEGAAFDEFVADIQERGQLEPIAITKENLVLDGRNRLKALERLGVAPVTKVVETDDPWRYVISANLRRRHLTTSQRAMIAARLAQRHKGGAAGLSAQQSADLRIAPPPTQAEAAAMFKVGERSLYKAKVIQEKGHDDLVEMVDGGELPVDWAERVARMSDTNQAAILERLHAGVDHRTLLDERIEPVPDAPPPAPTPRPDGQKLTNRHKGRHDFITETVVQAFISTLDGLDMAVERAVGGVDPAITSAEIDQLLADLSRSAGSIRRLRKLLHTEKDSRS